MRCLPPFQFIGLLPTEYWGESFPYYSESMHLSLCCRLISNNLRDLRDCIFVHVDNYVSRTVAVDTFTHLQNLSLSFHLTRNTGALLRVVSTFDSRIILTQSI